MSRRITKPRCTICRHARRAELEFAHVSGIGLDSIASRFEVNRMAVWRHCKNHLTIDDRSAYLADVDIRGLAERAHAESMSLMDYIAVTRGLLMRQLQLAAGMNDRSATAALAGKLTELLKLSANVTGELQRMAPTTTTTTIAVFVRSPAFDDLQAMLMRSLAHHPEALSKVVEGLRELEDKASAATPTPPMIDASPVEATCAAA